MHVAVRCGGCLWGLLGCPDSLSERGVAGVAYPPHPVKGLYFRLALLDQICPESPQTAELEWDVFCICAPNAMPDHRGCPITAAVDGGCV